MKRSVLIIMIAGLLISLPGTAYAVDVYVFDTKLEEISWTKVILGAVGSFFVHELAHITAAELTGCDYSFSFHQSSRVKFYPETDGQGRIVARGGFVLQNALGLGLRIFKPESSFTLGYTAFSCFQVMSYPLRRGEGGDFHIIRKYGGDDRREYVILSAVSLYNLIRIEW